jgi:hypothetical protein
MFAVMIPASVLVGGSPGWLLMGLCFGVLLLGSATAPVHVRRLASALAVALVLAVGATQIVPSVVIRCPWYVIDCWFA